MNRSSIHFRFTNFWVYFSSLKRHHDSWIHDIYPDASNPSIRVIQKNKTNLPDQKKIFPPLGRFILEVFWSAGNIWNKCIFGTKKIFDFLEGNDPGRKWRSDLYQRFFNVYNRSLDLKMKGNRKTEKNGETWKSLKNENCMPRTFFWIHSDCSRNF